MKKPPIHARCLMAASAVLLLGASIACAQTPRSAIKEFDLFGTWARDCQAAPGPSNPYTTFSEASGGGIFLRDDFGPVYGDMTYRIVEA